ncbi:hypothetical protein ACWD5Q_19130 [Streptomyces sp. NPDC002513]
MGNRHSAREGAVRRRAGTGGRMPGADGPVDTDGLERALGRALRVHALDTSAEQQAMAAFRAAREAGVREQARTRRRDDWRPRGMSARRSVKAAIAVFVASLTLGGVAIAAIGSPGSAGNPRDDAPERRHPTPSVPQDSTSASDGTGPSRPTGSVSPSRPPTAKDMQAHCRAYPSVKGRGKALDSSAWQRFLTAAGGEDNVAAFCADLLSRTGRGAPGTPGNANNGDSANNANTSGKATGKPSARPAGKEPGQPDRRGKGQRALPK